MKSNHLFIPSLEILSIISSVASLTIKSGYANIFVFIDFEENREEYPLKSTASAACSNLVLKFLDQPKNAFNVMAENFYTCCLTTSPYSCIQSVLLWRSKFQLILLYMFKNSLL